MIPLGQAAGLEDAEKLNIQAGQLKKVGRYNEAEVLYKKSITLAEQSLKPDHIALRTLLDNLALLYFDQGRYADAEPLRKRSLKILEHVLGPNHPDVAIALYNLALDYFEQGRYADAEPLYKRSLAIVENAQGPNHPDVASLLGGLAHLYVTQARFKDAEPLYKRSLRINEKAFGSDHIEVAYSLNGLATMHSEQKHYSDAELLFKRSLTIAEKQLGPNHPDVAQSLQNLGVLFYDQGRFSDAESLIKQSLTIYEKVFEANHPDIASSLDKLANIYVVQGRYSDAEAHYKRSLLIRENALGANHPDVASSLYNLAAEYVEQGRYSEAEPLFKRALLIRENALGANHPDVAEILNRLANLYVYQGRFLDAEPLYKRSLTVKERAFGVNHPDIAQTLNNLAVLYQDLGHFNELEPIFKRSLAINEESLGANHFETAISLNNLALFYTDQARYTEAVPLYKRSLKILDSVFGPEHPMAAKSLLNIARLNDKIGNYGDAEKLYKRSMEIIETKLGKNHPDTIDSLNLLAEHYFKQENFTDALLIIKRTIQAKQSSRAVTLSIISGSEKHRLINTEKSFSDSYSVFQFTSFTAAADAVARLSQRLSSGNNELSSLIRRSQDIDGEIKFLDHAIISSASMDPSKRDPSHEIWIKKRKSIVEAEYEKLREAITQKFPDYVALSKPQPLTIEETQQLLGDDEAVVALSSEEDNGYTWVVTKTDASWIQTPVKSADLNAEVSELRQSLTFSENGKAVDKPFNSTLAFKLYQQTLGPIADKIAGKKRLSIVANGSLTSIPLGLLVTKDPTGKSLKDTDWLIKSYAITVLPSIYSLKTMRAQAGISSAAKPMIAFADPLFSKAAQAQANQQVAMRSMTSFYNGTQIDIRSLGEHLSQLPNTRDEVQAISSALGAGPDDIKLGLQATETAVKQAKLDQYRIVYFATHGLVAGDLEKFSKAKAEPALVLTIPSRPTDQDDGLLQASEIAQLKLNADWAVLSACNTASSDGVGAEALSGLARAFIYAGARSLLVSNWDVSDDATKSLMTSLFEISSKNKSLSHGEALQQATLQLLNNAKTEEEAHPRYWAPFIVVGEPEKLNI